MFNRMCKSVSLPAGSTSFCYFRVSILPLLLSLLLSASETFASPLTKKEIDLLVANVMVKFDVPGISVGIVKGGEVIHLEGYGLRELGKKGKVNPDTIFKVASNTKAFTTAALSILVDEGKLSWDTKVAKVIPEFRLSDSWVTSELTVVDLLTHRSGMNVGAGDLMLWPEPNKFTRADIIYGLRYFDLVKQFRSEYAYDNLLYIVAGELIPRVTGKQWRDFVDARIMQRLSLKNCFAGAMTSSARRNLAAPHGLVEDELAVIDRSRISDVVSNMAAAGAVRCSAADMTTWMKVLLQKGQLSTEERLYTEEQAEQMWTPQIQRRIGDFERVWGNTHFSSYGLGWRISDVYGYKQVSHTGSLAGFRSYMTLVPELDLGVVVLTNGSSSMARKAVMYSLVRSYLTEEDVDWTSELIKSQQAFQKATVSEPVLKFVSTPKRLIEEIEGTYVDPWFGQVEISRQKGKLVLQSMMSPILVGELKYLNESTFVVYWFDRTLEADAYIRFERDQIGKIAVAKMQAVSPETDFSFDFHDLVLKRASR